MANVKEFTEGVRGDLLPGFPTPVCQGCEDFFNQTETSGCRNLVARHLERINKGVCVQRTDVVVYGPKKPATE